MATVARVDLSDVERDMLLLAIIGKSARQVAMTALRISVVKDVIVGSLAEFLLDHFNADAADDGAHSAAGSSFMNEFADAKEETRLIEASIAARHSVQNEARSNAGAAGHQSSHSSPRTHSGSSDTPLLSSRDNGRSDADKSTTGLLPPAMAPHRRLLSARPVSSRSHRSLQRRPLDAQAPLAAAQSLNEPMAASNGRLATATSRALADVPDVNADGHYESTLTGPQFASTLSSTPRDSSSSVLPPSLIQPAAEFSVPDGGWRRQSHGTADSPTEALLAASGGKAAAPLSPTSDGYAGASTASHGGRSVPSSSPAPPLSDAGSQSSEPVWRNTFPGVVPPLSGEQFKEWAGSRGGQRSSVANASPYASSFAMSRPAPSTQSLSCTECGRGFKSPQALRFHSTMHDGGLPLCQPLRKRQTLSVPPPPSQPLRQHSGYDSRHSYGDDRPLLHSGGPPNFRCLECCKEFRRQSELNRHIKIVHRQEKPYHCDQCGIPFATRWNLKCHYNKRHAFQSRLLAPRSLLSVYNDTDPSHVSASEEAAAADVPPDSDEGDKSEVPVSQARATSDRHLDSYDDYFEAADLKQEAGSH